MRWRVCWMGLLRMGCAELSDIVAEQISASFLMILICLSFRVHRLEYRTTP
jgi:hypothetical protein